ncbi:MAG TPA: OmpH family outer membrane protein [Balneolales bacterium]|nr:OmpH family outer membrane protein [Balneolales bacterium]
MKRAFTFGLFSLTIAMVGVSSTLAQQKIGYIDSDYIMSKIPEYSGIKERLDLMSKDWKKQVDKMDQQIAQMKSDYKAKEILYTPEVRKQKQQEIQDKIQEKNNFLDSKFGPNGEYYQKQKELLQPLQQKILKAVNTVAQEEGYDYVFDRSGDYLFVYTRPEWNLSDKILQEMGIQVEQTGN